MKDVNIFYIKSDIYWDYFISRDIILKCSGTQLVDELLSVLKWANKQLFAQCSYQHFSVFCLAKKLSENCPSLLLMLHREVQWFNISKPAFKVLYLHFWHLYLFGTRLVTVLFIYLLFCLCLMMVRNVIAALTLCFNFLTIKFCFCNTLLLHLMKLLKTVI